MTLHKEGRKFLLKLLAVFLLLNLAVYGLWRDASLPFGVLTALLWLFFFNFFRRPERLRDASDDDVVVAPCDGRVVVIEPTDEREVLGERRIQISIFMSIFDVHANWYPVNGRVVYHTHQDGRFHSAHLPKSSTENERSTLIVETPHGIRVLVRQIAGALAQRIVTYANIGNAYTTNDELGFIKFGSRMDIYLPLDSEVLVRLGDKTRGNQTVIARLHPKA